MSQQAVQLRYDAIRSIDSSTFTGSYQSLGTALTVEPRIIKIINDSDQLITLSTDGGANDHDVLTTGTFTLYDAGANRNNAAPYLAFPKGTQFLIKGSAGTGLVYLVVLYAYTLNQTLPL